MYKKTKLDTWLEVVIWLSFLALIIGSCSGCASWKYSRTNFDPDGSATEQVEVSGYEFLIDSSIDNVNVEIAQDGTRKMSIGNVSRDTDEEATEAVVEGVVAGLLKAVVPIP